MQKTEYRFNRTKFWAEFRTAFYPLGGIRQETVTALEQILDWIEDDIKYYGLNFFSGFEGLAYLLGTWKLEARKKFRVTEDGKRKYVWIDFNPVEEMRANPNTQAKLYKSQTRYFKDNAQGRGLTQVTWLDNYFKVGELQGVKGERVNISANFTSIPLTISGAVLRDNPDLMLNPRISYLAATRGAIHGIFRPPHKLSSYFIEGKAPRYVPARAIINGGGDKAEEITANARAFERILRASLKEMPTLEVIKGAGLSVVDNALQENIISLENAGTISGESKPESKPENESNGGEETPTGETEGEPPQTKVKPTSLKGWIVSVAGFIFTNIAAVSTWLAGLPPIVQASLYLSGGLVTAALVIGVIWLKNQREARANAKDIELIRAQSAGNAPLDYASRVAENLPENKAPAERSYLTLFGKKIGGE